MKEIIKSVGKILSEGINYRFLRWKGKPQYPYFIGELHRVGGSDESGEEEYRMLLTGFYRGGDDMQLYEAAERVGEMFPEDTGRLIRCRAGTMLVSAGEILPDIQTEGETELLKMQITLVIKRWKGKG
ncbi:MAG: hypothetical protein OSJ72_16985 [Lachnospiraceae bacterium]|nr:hypothetical protein [Lachnospiraceae bacterium]